LKTLDFSGLSWYNKRMDNKAVFETRNTEMVSIPRAEYEYLQAQVQWLMEQLRLLKKRAYGASSEKASEEVYEQLSLLFNEAEAFEDAEAGEAAKAPAVEVKAYTRTKKSGNVRDIVPKDIPVEVVEHHLSDEELACPQCGSQMTAIGKEVKETLVFKPAEAYIRQDVYYTYACQNCKENEETTPVIQTPKESALIPGSYASPEAVAHIAVQKFKMGSPLYRQEQEWNAAGIMLSRQTMSNWLVRCSNDWCKPIYDELRQRMMERHDLLHADETEVQVLHEPGRTPQSKSYMWLYRTSGDAEHPIVLYDYRSGRGQEHPNAFLEGFHGYLQTDGYSGYNGLKDVVHVGCWAHVRRKFEEARQAAPNGKRSPTAEQGVAYCTKLFDLETRFKDLHPEERKKKRLEQAKPVLDAMLVWANTRNAAPKSKLGIALNYLKNQWPTLVAYLEDGRIELSNNRAERSIKPFVIARKNFLFANTPSGAESSAVLFSLIETAKEEGLDPYLYLVWVFREAPGRSTTERKWAASLLPQCAPVSCRSKSAN
jgi:transposase